MRVSCVINNNMIQVLIANNNIDLANGTAISLVFRSKMFGAAQGARTWTLRCGRTATNELVFGEMQRVRRYEAPAVVLFGGIPMVRGRMRLTGWDNAGYSVVVVADASTSLADDKRTVLQLFREWCDQRGGYGAADTSTMWRGTFERGDMSDRWMVSDWFFGSVPQLGPLIKMLRTIDTAPERWPSDEWLDAQPYMAKVGLYGAEPVQVGGWTGLINCPVDRNKLTYDVVQCEADVYEGGYAPSYILGRVKYLDLRGMSDYPAGTGLRIREFGQNTVYWAQGRGADGSYAQGYVCSADGAPAAQGATLLPTGSWLACKPYIAVSHTEATHTAIIQLEELLSVSVVGIGTAVGYLTTAQLIDIQRRQHVLHNLTPADVQEVSYTVQERAIDDIRANDMAGAPSIVNGQAYWPEKQRPSLYYSPTARPAMVYEPLSSYGALTVSDIAQLCLHVLNLDIDTQGSTGAMLSQTALLEATGYTAEVVAATDIEGQQQGSAKQGVVAANGVELIRGGTAVEPLKLANISAVQFFSAKYPRKQLPTDPDFPTWGTTLAASTAEKSNTEKGAWLMMADTFPYPYAWSPPLFLGRRIGATAPASPTQPAAISRGIKYTARGRVNAAQLMALKPDGRIQLQGYGIGGVVEQITWSSSGEVEVVFWG